MKVICKFSKGYEDLNLNQIYTVVEEDNNHYKMMEIEGQWFDTGRFEIIPEKQFISDQMIKDIYSILPSYISTVYCSEGFLKRKLKEKGYEVEEPKSKLDEIIEYAKTVIDESNEKEERYNKLSGILESIIEELKRGIK
jgi:hypothetical protein